MFWVPIVVVKKVERKEFLKCQGTVHTSNKVLLTRFAPLSLSLEKNVNTTSTDLYMCETEPDLTIPANRRLEFESQQQQQLNG